MAKRNHGRTMTRSDLATMRENLKRAEWVGSYVSTEPTTDHRRRGSNARNKAIQIATAVPGVTLAVLSQTVSERTIRRAVADGALAIRENRLYAV